MLIIGLMLSAIAMRGWANDSNIEDRAIVVNPSAQPPFKNPGVLTLGTLTIESRVDFAVSATAVTASGGKGGALTYAWDWGDGTPPGSGAASNHTYVVPGTYTVTVTILEAGNPTPTVLTLPVVITDAVKSMHLQTNEVWGRTGKDSLNLSGTIRVPKNLSTKGQNLSFDIGGVQLNFVLDNFGAASVSTGTNIDIGTIATITSNGNTVVSPASTAVVNNNKASVKLFVRQRAAGDAFVDSPFILQLKGAIQDALADETITNRDANRDNVRITVKVTYDNMLFQTNINQQFTSKKNGKGKTR